MFAITLTAVCALLAFIVWKISKKQTNLPPGIKETPLERGLPIIGILHQVEGTLYNYITKLGKKHGPIFRIKFGMRDILILNDFDTMKKTLKDDGDNFSGRWTSKLFSVVSHNCGVLFTFGDLWATQKSFILRVLRDFGLGKSKSLEIVQNECSSLLDELEENDGKSVDFSQLIPIYTANIISKFIMNKRFMRSDTKFSVFEKLLTSILRTKDVVQLSLLMFPYLDQSEWFCKFIMKVTSKMEMFDNAHDLFREEIENHIKTLDYNSEGEDLMDRFLIKQHRLKETSGTEETFTNWQLIRNSFELFIAGYETTSTTLGWSFMFMSRYPEIQTKVYNEIFDHIGTERLPTMIDKKSLNYTQAVMDEILRLSSVTPFANSHINFKDSIVDGYFIPKNTLIFPNLFACHRDRNIWEKPDEFYPEHFILRHDELEYKYNPRDELIPFGIGKRQCLGESLARMEYFIFFTSILQKFQVRFSGDVSQDQYANALNGNDGIIRSSSVKDFVFVKRV